MYTCVYLMVLVIQNNVLFYAFLQSFTHYLILSDFISFDEENILRNSSLYSFHLPPFTASLLGLNGLSIVLFSQTIILFIPLIQQFRSK
jgi:hypothetical protein